MKDNYYFPHDAESMNDPRIVKLINRYKMSGYGVFYAINELLRIQDNYCCHLSLLKMLARKINVNHQMVLSVVTDFELFVVTDEWFYSEDMCRRMKKFDLNKCKIEERKARKEAANELKIKLELLREEAEMRHKEKEIEKEMEMEKEIKTIVESKEEKKEEKLIESPEVNEEIAKTTTTTTTENPNNCLVECLNFTYPPLRQPGDSKKWIAHVDKAFTDQMWLDIVGMKSGLGLLFKDNCVVLKQLFKDQVILMDKMETIRCPSDAKRYFANCMQSGTEVYARLVKNLKEILSKKDPYPFEDYDPKTGIRRVFGVTIPAWAPPRPDCSVRWNVEENDWTD
ncbi:MAG: DUF4373 domain-containing protein [Bacteroidales bacterium]|nr:DUF4373 domain-containing protein [Bacteroidales bacterium]